MKLKHVCENISSIFNVARIQKKWQTLQHIVIKHLQEQWLRFTGNYGSTEKEYQNQTPWVREDFLIGATVTITTIIKIHFLTT
jgi:hypothetical protein